MTDPHRDEPVGRGEILAVAAIVLVAAALRIYRLDYWPLYGDETLTISHITKWDRHIRISPLAYLPVVGVVKLVGTSTWGWRLWSCLVGIVSIPLIYLPTRRVGGRAVALWSALLMALAPWHIAQSQTARHYPLQLLIGFYVVYATYRAIEDDSTAYYLLSVLFGLLAVFTRPSSIYLMFVVFSYCGLIWVWPALRPPAVRWRRVVLLVAAHAALVLVAYHLTSVYGKGNEAWGHSPLHVILTTVYYLTAPAFLAALAASGIGLFLRNRVVILLGIYAFVPVAMVAATAMFRSAIGVATFLVLPAVLLLSAWGASEVGARHSGAGRWFPALIGLALVGAFVARDYEYFTIAHGYRAPIKVAAAYIRNHRRPSDLVAFNARGSREEMGTTLGDTASISLYPATLDTIPAFSAEARTWFVSEDILSTWDIPDPVRRWLNAHARLVTVVPAYIGPRSKSLWIYLYTPPKLRRGGVSDRGDDGRRTLSFAVRPESGGKDIGSDRGGSPDGE